MPIIKNGKNVTAIYKGTTQIIKVYKGLQLVWEAFKNLIVSGVTPLTLPNSIGKPMVDYQIDGNSIQASDPTPDSPVEVESVGDRTYNLIDYSDANKTINGVTFERKSDGSIVCNGTATADAIFEVGWAELKNGIRYRGTGCPAGGSTSTYRLFFNYLGADLGNGSSATVFTEDRRTQVRLFIYTGQVCDNLTFYPMLTEVPDTTTKLPYKPSGYEIPVKVGGKNLFDINSVELTKNCEIVDNGIRFTGSGDFDILLPAGQYTISFENNGIGTCYLRNGKVASGYIAIINPTDTHKTFNFSASYDGYLRISSFSDGQMLSNIQIEVGDTATAYEPYFEPMTTSIYLDEPLRKVGTYADYIDFENKKVVRNIAVSELGTSWSKYSTYNTYFTAQFTNAKYALNVPCFCNYYKGQNSGSGTSYTTGNAWFQNDPTYKRFYIADDNYTTLDEFRNYMRSLTTPIEVTYVLNTPTEETIELPTIPTGKNTNIIYTETTVTPSDMEVTYKGR